MFCFLRLVRPPVSTRTATLLPCATLSRALRRKVVYNYQRAQPRPDEPVPVTVVDLDDDTLAKLGQWPWPRTLLADLIGRLQELGAATIALRSEEHTLNSSH